jgi:hypothetical protein
VLQCSDGWVRSWLIAGLGNRLGPASNTRQVGNPAGEEQPGNAGTDYGVHEPLLGLSSFRNLVIFAALRSPADLVHLRSGR